MEFLPDSLFAVFGYFIILIVVFVIVLSASGKSTGIREKFAEWILAVFQWAAEYDAAADLYAGRESDSKRSSANNSFSRDGHSDDDERSVSEVADEISHNVDAEILWSPNVRDPQISENMFAPWNSPGSQVSKTKIIRQNSSGELAIIDRRWSSSLDRKLRSRSPSKEPGFENRARPPSSDPELETLTEIMSDTGLFITAGMEAIIEDEVTSRFKAAQLPSWNFLSRSRAAYKISWKLAIIWLVGCILRYCVFFPIRLILFVVSGTLLIVLPALIGYIPDEKLRERVNCHVMLMCMRMGGRAFSAIITFHNKENRPTHGICVANHTSPIDVMNLSCDNCYAMIGQKQGGFLGMLQRSLSRSSHHIWFERSEAKDRKQVSQRLREHVEDPNKLPILIFPEGTCINNTSVMLFKKGSFEVSTTIYPIAIRYDNRLGDAFWNSHEQGYFSYLLSMMTAWAMVCHVWYLPPVTRKEDEGSVEFARRVQRIIAKAGGLVDLQWDGNLKRAQVPERLKAEQKHLFYRYLTRTTAICECGKKSSGGLNSSGSDSNAALSRCGTEMGLSRSDTGVDLDSKKDNNSTVDSPKVVFTAAEESPKTEATAPTTKVEKLAEKMDNKEEEDGETEDKESSSDEGNGLRMRNATLTSAGDEATTAVAN